MTLIRCPGSRKVHISLRIEFESEPLPLSLKPSTDLPIHGPYQSNDKHKSLQCAFPTLCSTAKRRHFLPTRHRPCQKGSNPPSAPVRARKQSFLLRSASEQMMEGM